MSDTEEGHTSVFQQHGDYRVGMDGNIILFQSFGAWNKEGSLGCTRLISKFIDSLQGKRFGILIDSIDFQGVTGDGYFEWSDSIQYWVEHNCVSVIRIDDVNTVRYKTFLQSFDKMFREVTLFRNAESFSEALDMFLPFRLKGFESGLESVVAYGPEGEKLPFRIR